MPWRSRSSGRPRRNPANDPPSKSPTWRRHSKKFDITWSGFLEYKYLYDVKYDPKGSAIPFWPKCWFQYVSNNNRAD